jgi:hypothetical protein
MSEKCRQGLTAAEKPELWRRWQTGILKAIIYRRIAMAQPLNFRHAKTTVAVTRSKWMNDGQGSVPWRSGVIG